MASVDEQHFLNSSFREKLIEHLFVGELLKLAWQKTHCSMEIARPEVDNRGYDLIAESQGVARHIQLKASRIGAKATGQSVQHALAEKPSGCVLWIYFNEETLDLGPFLFYGGTPGKPLPPIAGFKMAKHTKANAQGIKTAKPGLSVVPRTKFNRLDSIQEVYDALFLAAAPCNP